MWITRVRAWCGLFVLNLVLFGSGACSSDDTAEKGDGQAGAAQGGHHGKGHQGAGDDEYAHHGSMPHRFEHAEEWAKRFENPERDAWQKPDEVLVFLGLTPDQSLADVGSATGYFSVRAARLLTKGRVWGVDIEPDMVRYLNERAQAEGLQNLSSVLGTPDQAKIPEPVDMVLVVNTYHHIQDRPRYFQALAANLKPGGRVAIVDFKKDATAQEGGERIGPPPAMRISAGQLEQEMLQAGYVLDKSNVDLLEHQYILVFSRR